MFFLYNMFQDANAVSPTANNPLIDTIRISNGIYKHLNLLNRIDIRTNVFDKTIPMQWEGQTLLDATFRNTIDGGSLSQIISDIDHFDLQRQEVGTTEWITLQSFYKKNTPEITYTLSEGSGIDRVIISKSAFIQQVKKVGTYEFNFNGENWLLNGNSVVPSTFGLTIVGTPTTNTIMTLNYTTESDIITNFTLYDTFGQNGKNYIYQLVPYDSNGDKGHALQQEVLSMFNKAYIADATHIYNITNEYTFGSASTNQVSSFYTPIGSKYPLVEYNALTSYHSASVTAVLLAPTSNARLDRLAQTKLRDEFNSWLTNRQPKIMKDFNGNFRVVAVVDAVSNNYYKELANGLASTSFNVVEIGDFSQDYLNSLNLLNHFPLYTKK